MELDDVLEATASCKAQVSTIVVRPTLQALEVLICQQREYWSRKFAPAVLAEECHTILEVNAQVNLGETPFLEPKYQPTLSHHVLLSVPRIQG